MLTTTWKMITHRLMTMRYSRLKAHMVLMSYCRARASVRDDELE